MTEYETLQSEKHANLRVVIFYDEDPSDPRKEWCNVATMACWHGRYNLGDEQPDSDPIEHMAELADVDATVECEHCDNGWVLGDDGERTEELCAHCDGHGYIEPTREEIEAAFDAKFYHLPLYLYDHSGITMSTGRFSCPWDSGQVGFIYVEKEKAIDEWGILHRGPMTPEMIEQKAYEYLTGEVETYDQYLTGDVYGYVVQVAEFDEDGDPEWGNPDEPDSCWGFFGSDSAEDEAKSVLTDYEKKLDKELAEAQHWAERDVVTV